MAGLRPAMRRGRDVGHAASFACGMARPERSSGRAAEGRERRARAGWGKFCPSRRHPANPPAIIGEPARRL